MKTTVKKSSDTNSKKENKLKDDAPKVSQDDKLKKTSNNISTPNNFIQKKTTTADIYGQKKKGTAQSVKAPKKSPSTSYLTSSASPMKDFLRSSPSSTSHISTRSERLKMATPKTDVKTKYSATPRGGTEKSKSFSVLVNSPIVKRKLNMELEREKSFINDVSKERPAVKKEKSFIKEVSKDKKIIERGNSFVKNAREKREKDKERSFIKEVAKEKEKDNSSLKFPTERQRTKTRTLEENEVKVLKTEAVDNNKEMFNLSQKLAAKPKAFYIELDDEKSKPIKKPSLIKSSSEDEVSYEDDFESYESDFDSYHSSSPSDHNASEETNDEQEDHDDEDEAGETPAGYQNIKDDEKMLDSGNFDLRDQRSANKSKPAALDFILEASETGDKPSSLTDEGFQEMSSCSAVSSIRTVHIDVLDRYIFIDFTKSKENRRKKRIGDRLRQRAKDLLSIITLHEMSYSLFEMKPISYDLFMATFGRSNYNQVAVQTFDDGISEEVQTEEIECEHKWTQHPVEFTNNDICIKEKVESRKYSKNMEDYLTKFTFLTTQTPDFENNNVINLDENYKTDPLRIYFEQKDGVGPSEMLPHEKYKAMLKRNDYNAHRLGKFLKKIESRISSVLNTNSGNTELSELKITKYPFSKGYTSVSTKHITDEKLSFLNNTKISKMYFSETKSNLIISVHQKGQNVTLKKCTICLWDISVAMREPIKILTAISNVAIGRLRGATDGYFAAALEDGSIHLWDLSEQPTWREDVVTEKKCTELVEVNEKEDGNKKNSHIGLDEVGCAVALQSCAYTNSAYNMSSIDETDCIVGLELTGDSHSIVSQEGGRKILGQVVSLQRIGVLTLWSIVQHKSKTIPPDIGKAFWSRMKLEKNQTISLVDHINIPPKDTPNGDSKLDFNLNAAKRRLVIRKQEKNLLRKEALRPKSANSLDFYTDRPSSAASAKIKRVLSVEKDVSKDWESGIVCDDLKVMNCMNSDHYLIAKNCGEVLCCKRILGAVKVNKFCVATGASSVTCLEVSPHRLPYFLAATNTGTISVCSLIENRVLLTLDCQNIQVQDIEKCQSDHKGRYVSSVSTRTHGRGEKRATQELMVRFLSIGGKLDLAISFPDSRARNISAPHRIIHQNDNLAVTSIAWSHINPCCLFASLLDGSIVEWELSYSDIYAKCASDAAALACAAGDSTLALLTPEGEVHVHKLSNEHRTKEFLLLFEKYVALL